MTDLLSGRDSLTNYVGLAACGGFSCKLHPPLQLCIERSNAKSGITQMGTLYVYFRNTQRLDSPMTKSED